MTSDAQANDDNLDTNEETEDENLEDAHLDPRRRTFLSFPPEQQRRFLEKERVIKHCIRERLAHKGRIPSATKQLAVSQLGITPRQLELDIRSYQEFIEIYPYRPSVEGAIPRTVGRTAHQSLTADQQAIAIFAYLSPAWIAVIRNKSARLTHNVVPTVEMVYDLMQELYDDFAISIHGLRRFLNKHYDQHRGMHDLARKGEHVFWDQYVASRNNDVDRPNIRWQADARPLPVYIQHDNTTCTVTLLVLQDDYSRKIVSWMVLPRKVRDEDGDIRRVDFSEHHARILLVNAFTNTNIRPYMLYTDNGKQFASWKDTVKYLTDPNEPAIYARYSQEGKPRGRGKVEAFLKSITAKLKGSFGLVINEKEWRLALSKIQKHTERLDTLEEIRAVIAEAVTTWNMSKSRGLNITRNELWENGKAHSLPAPESYRYYAFGAASFWDYKSVSNDGVYHGGINYIPLDRDGYLRQQKAIGKTKVPFALIEGENHPIAFVSFCDDYWEQLVPSNHSLLSVDEHVKAQDFVQQSVKKTLEEGFKSLYEVVGQRLGLSHPAFFRGSNTLASKDDVEVARTQAKRKKQQTSRTMKNNNRQNAEGVSFSKPIQQTLDDTPLFTNFDDDLFAPDIYEE